MCLPHHKIDFSKEVLKEENFLEFLDCLFLFIEANFVNLAPNFIIITAKASPSIKLLKHFSKVTIIQMLIIKELL